MLNIPYMPIIPIILFIVILVMPIILGIVRGWKISLLFIVSMMIMIGIEVIIGFSLYDKIWDLLKNVYIGNVKAGLNKDALKEVAKPSVIILFIGMCIPASYLVFYSFYFPFRKKLKKHLYPKTKDISENEREIYRSPNVISRSVGGLLSVTMSLGLASIAATSATALFIPSEKRKSFHRNVSSISKIYTFGKGELNKEVIKLKQFAEKFLTTDIQNYLSDILILGQTENPNIQASTAAISTSIFHDELLNIKDDEKSMKALVELILTSTLFTQSQTVTLMDKNYTRYSEWGVKMNQVSIIYDDMDNHLMNINNLNISPKFYLSDSIIDIFTNQMGVRQITPFEKTGFFLEWSDNKDILDKINITEKQLINRRNRLIGNYNTTIGELNQVYQKQSELIKELIALGHDKLIPADDSYNKFEYQKPTMQLENLINNIGTIEQLINQVDNLTQIRDNARANQNITDISYAGAIDASDGDGGISKRHNDLANLVTTAKNNLDLKSGELKTINTELTDLIVEKDRQENLWRTNEDKYNSITQPYLDRLITNALNEEKISNKLQNDINTNKAQLTTATSDLASAGSDENDKREIVNNLESAIHLLETQKSNHDTNARNYRNEHSNKTREKHDYQNAFTEAKKKYLNHLNNLIPNKQADKKNKQDEVSSATTSWTNSKNVLSNYDRVNNYTGLKTQYNNNKQTLIKAKQDLNTGGQNLNVSRKRRDDIKETIVNLHKQRDSYVNALKDSSDNINKLNSFAVPPFQEQKTAWAIGPSNPNAGTVSVVKTFDSSINIQNNDYYLWAQDTIPGVQNYIKNQEAIIRTLENIKNNKEFEYNNLKDKYLNTIREILRR